ncbi:hypothetical protein N7G274_007714 [Stereocaulon virgatum]|uniref:Fucose-specific lectin n=1 Tax=Stereocaulon virgatum TaxID=373712 RepID=A0ABR4A0I2_9LECA
MSRHSSSNLEKSPVERCDYEGLQLDTRARENLDRQPRRSRPQGFLEQDYSHEGTYINEKHDHATMIDQHSPKSPESAAGPGPSPTTPLGLKTDEEMLTSPATASAVPTAEGRRMCGLRPRHFWELFGLILAVVIAAAVIGGVVGGLQKHGNNSPPAAPAAGNSTNAKNFVTVQPSDVMIGSPLAVVTYDDGPTTESLEYRQVFRLYFQSALGNIKEAFSEHLNPWQNALPIFTDAINNTGLASVTYLNNTSQQQQGSIFYVGMNGLLQEKRKIYNDTNYWEPGTLNLKNIPMTGNISLPPGKKDPENEWDGYRLAAVYSTKFHNGPGIRLFYHSQWQSNGTSFVQELIWNQQNDSWTKGVTLNRVWPNSHMAATIDDSTNILRLFFSSGNNALQELYLSITDPSGQYTNGLTLDNSFLNHNNADIAAISINGTAHLYHYASTNQTATPGIHELIISGTPGSINDQEAYNLSTPLVSSPTLIVNGYESDYQPLAVSNTAVVGLQPQIYVFWADKVTGDPNAKLSGYGELLQISKPFTKVAWPTTGSVQIPLGNSNSQPS